MEQFDAQDVFSSGRVLGGTASSSVGTSSTLNATAVAHTLKKGVYILRYADLKTEMVNENGLLLPLVQLSVSPENSTASISILGQEHSPGAWLKQPGDWILFKVDFDTENSEEPSETATIILTIFSSEKKQENGVKLELEPFNVTGKSAESEINVPRIDATAHIQNVGNATFKPGEWVGKVNSHLRLEGITLSCLELGDSALEYKVISIDGRETPWIASPNYCGTRGRGLPLAGFGIRLKAPFDQQYDVVYRGSFYEGGQTGAESNGKFCRATLPNDPMEAIQVTLRPKQKMSQQKDETGFDSFI